MWPATRGYEGPTWERLMDLGGQTPGVHVVVGPVFSAGLDVVRVGLGVSVPPERGSREEMLRLGGILRKVCDQVSAEMGPDPYALVRQIRDDLLQAASGHCGTKRSQPAEEVARPALPHSRTLTWPPAPGISERPPSRPCSRNPRPHSRISRHQRFHRR